MAFVILTGWKYGLNKVILTKLQMAMLGKSLKESKQNVDDLLEDKEIILEIEDVKLAYSFLKEAESIGAIGTVVLSEHEELLPDAPPAGLIDMEILVLGFMKDRLEFYYMNGSTIRDVIKLKGVNYQLESSLHDVNGFLGFFDWLRSDKNEITGVRLQFFDWLIYDRFLSGLPYLDATLDNARMEILFVDTPFKNDLSCDQEFGTQYLYTSPDGGCLLTFGIDSLNDEELDSLLGYCTSVQEEE